jgi:hypothetical protein
MDMLDGSTPRITIAGALGWVAALGGTLAMGRVAPSAAFSVGLGLSTVAALRHVPERPVGGFRLNEAIALLVLLFGLTILSTPSSSGSRCGIPTPRELGREFRHPSPGR